MIRINLLPHREEKRRARRQQFGVLAGLVSLLAGLIVFLGYTIINGTIEAQLEKNAFLKTEIDSLDKQIVEIKGLQEQIQLLLSRKQIIETLQQDRAEPVHLLNEFVKQTPDGVYLKSLKQTGSQVALTGISQSNARISLFMRNLDSSKWLQTPLLIESKATTIDKKRVNEFTMTVTVTRSKP
jgi:type IV pilus assembly protein PilN